MPLFNIIFFALYFRVLGGMFTKKGTTENAVSRYISLPVGFCVLALQFYDEPSQLVAWCYAFVVIRLLSTRPLLDATHDGYNDFGKGIIRNMWILPALPFTSWWLGLFLGQVFIYYFAGKLARRYSWIKSVTLSEVLSGGVFGLCLSL